MGKVTLHLRLQVLAVLLGKRCASGRNPVCVSSFAHVVPGLKIWCNRGAELELGAHTGRQTCLRPLARQLACARAQYDLQAWHCLWRRHLLGSRKVKAVARSMRRRAVSMLMWPLSVA